MTGHYNVPITESWYPELLLRSPNLGIPCLIREVEEITFDVLFGGTKDNLNVKSLLKGRLFLQSLSDTRQILQDKKVKNVHDMDDLISCLRQKLIPLRIEKVKKPIKSEWLWRGYGHKEKKFPYAYWVTLKIGSKQIKCLKKPQLFNFIQNFPEVNWYNINFHSVYICKKDWHNFRFIHVPDTHIAWRNDTILEVLKAKYLSTKLAKDFEKFKKLKERYVNFNQNFRDFIKYANNLHRQGKLDFIMLNGDIVDFVNENYRPDINIGKTPYYPRLIDNFEFFWELVIAWGSKEGIIVGEELEVPIFTILGNHDYRVNEYPLIFKLVIKYIFAPTGHDISPQKAEPVSNYGAFNLTKDEALDFEGGLRRIHQSKANKFAEYIEDAPINYKTLINPDRDYVINLGKHKMVFLDSSHDEGVVDSIVKYLFRNKSEKMFVEGSPDSAGFCKEQIDFLANEMKDAKGLVSVTTHAPLMNLRYTPHHLLRETEHNRKFKDIEKEELLYFMLANHPDATEIEKFFDDYGALIIGGPAGAFIKGLVDLLNKALGKSPMKKMKDAGWVFGNSKVFKAFDRDPYIAWGVIAHRFKEFIETIEKRINQEETAVLVLTGHTHKNIEYVVTCRGATEQTKFIRFYHDYYIDNTIHGQRPQDYWYSEKIPNYDPKYQKPKEELWHHRSPLFIQTLSLGPKPSSQRPQFNKAKPIGYSNVKNGEFSLYDLDMGPYEIVFESSNKNKRWAGGIYVSDKNAKGEELELDLQAHAKSKMPKRLYEKSITEPDFPKYNLGKGNILVVSGKIHEIISGLQIEKCPLISYPGKISVYKVPHPVGGVLLITVKDDLIDNMERIYLDKMREEKIVKLPTPHSAYFILSTSSP